jgi:hypothetical protein
MFQNVRKALGTIPTNRNEVHDKRGEEQILEISVSIQFEI